jgi:poly-gamma-glutamate capsule biosynthesis protein CapA/YwtB (metallophosphatase superfamily)
MVAVVLPVTTVVLTGDVMTGRGIDQIMPSPSEPELMASYVRDARVYVELAEAANAPADAPPPDLPDAHSNHYIVMATCTRRSTTEGGD